MKRRCENWLLTLKEYTTETESPSHFWLWSGLFCIGCALQRKVWLPFGMDSIFPNLYIMIVAEPGWCRKAAPVQFAKKILTEIECNVFVDSPSNRAITEELDRLSRTCHFKVDERSRPQSPLVIISRELSSFLRLDPKGIIEILTDIYDPHDVWDYKTSKSGSDKVRGLCVSCLMASTPSWIAKNLPDEAIGGGFTSRFVIVSGREPQKDISLPPPPPKKLYQALVHDLAIINRIIGEIVWDQEAFEVYDTWYSTIRPKAKNLDDERVQASFSRIHVMAIKTAICLHVAYSNTLVIGAEDMQRAIELLEDTFSTAGRAFSSLGRSELAYDTERVRAQIQISGAMTFADLLRMNWRNLNRTQLNEVLDTLQAMGRIKREFKEGRIDISWLK